MENCTMRNYHFWLGGDAAEPENTMSNVSTADRGD
jgi:hypothetical protein